MSEVPVLDLDLERADISKLAMELDCDILVGDILLRSGGGEFDLMRGDDAESEYPRVRTWPSKPAEKETRRGITETTGYVELPEGDSLTVTVEGEASRTESSTVVEND